MLNEATPKTGPHPAVETAPSVSGSALVSLQVQSLLDAGELPPQFIPVFRGWRNVVNWIGIGLWLAALVFFWQWWLQPIHVSSWYRYSAVTLVLVWITLVPGYYIFIFAGALRPSPDFPLPEGARIAIVVTKAPAEPWDMVRKTLLGALGQRGVKHDTWLADEDPTVETLDWCRKHGVQVSCRKGVEEYHRATWPRRTRCKEGNLAYFYDKYGYDRYDFVSQFDADHVPGPDYLRNAIAQFSNPAVGYVSAPSICDSNASASWSARGRLYLEGGLHGALQTGYNAGWAPLCIGSHYSVRTAALRQAGGLGPELAEDHSTTMLMNAAGWRGVHAVDAIAHGEGPWTFADLATQELQWSRSLMTILLTYTPVYFSRLPGRLKFQFLFAQLWYSMFSGIMALSVVFSIYALASGANFANVTYVDFFIHMAPLSLSFIVFSYWWRALGAFRPVDTKILCWESLFFLILRWPWSFLGGLLAIRDKITGRFVDFRITPKKQVRSEALPFRVLAPYIGLSLASALVSLLVKDPGTAAGFHIYNIINAIIFASGVVLILVRHAVENRLTPRTWNWESLMHAMAVIAMGTAIYAAINENGSRGLAAMTAGITAFSLTESRSLPAGASFGTPGGTIVRFKPRWNGFSWQKPDSSDQDEEQ
jgi:cellulose synthase (UDP-forming)